MLEQVTADIVRLRLGIFPGVNVYLVEEPDGLTIVDSGFFMHGRIIERHVVRKHVKRILLTHFHPDHSGSAAYLQRLTGAPVYVHEADEPFVADRRRLEDEPGWEVTRFMLRAIRRLGLGRTEPPAELIALREGDRVGRFQVLHTPGHTPGSSSFLHGEVLLCGDNLVHMPWGFRIGVPWWTLDHALQRRSIARYRGLGARLVLSGHGPPWRGDLDSWLQRFFSRLG